MGMLSVVNALHRIKGQQNTVGEMFFTSFSSETFAIYFSMY